MKLRNLFSITLGLAVGCSLSYICYRRSQVRALPPHQSTFPKRIFNLAGFRRSMRDFLIDGIQLERARQSGRIDKSFAERLMLTVSVVNGCRACCYMHSRFALRAGVSPEEIQRVRMGDWVDAPVEELVALLFAQHFAESGGAPAPEARTRLTETYGETKARDLLAFIRFAQLTNLFGNTAEALWSRLLGIPAPRSAWWQEGSILLLGLILFPATMLRYRWKFPKPVSNDFSLGIEDLARPQSAQLAEQQGGDFPGASGNRNEDRARAALLDSVAPERPGQRA